MRYAGIHPLADRFGRVAVVEAIRNVLAEHRKTSGAAGAVAIGENDVVAAVADRLQGRATPTLRRMINLTGTVLHTNLGRALLPEAAVAHATLAMRHPCNLEYDVETGGRGDRDNLVEGVLTELTGAEAATVVNNNAAAVLLVLAALAWEREVVVSRGELVEIGGSFRIPDVMRSANARLVEVGTTNRTHPADYERAIGPATAALMKVHASNYQITGFVADVAETELATIAHRHDLPLIVDLGAGSLIDLSAHGLPKEAIVRDAITGGADIVTFSGDKLLGGPQAGLIVGRRELIDRIRRHPLKRALRLSKITLAALEATLLCYRSPDQLARTLPTLRLLTRSVEELRALAQRLQPALAAALGQGWQVDIAEVASQVGSGSLPVEIIPSIALTVAQSGARSGKALAQLADRLRELPVPVIGRIAEQRLVLDLRCLEDEPAFLATIGAMAAAA